MAQVRRARLPKGTAGGLKRKEVGLMDGISILAMGQKPLTRWVAQAVDERLLSGRCKKVRTKEGRIKNQSFLM